MKKKSLQKEAEKVIKQNLFLKKGAFMELQNFEKKDQEIKEKFLSVKKSINTKERLKLSWSNWEFGMEPLETSVKRLSSNNVKYIELFGNLFGPDLGYKAKDVNKLLKSYGMEVSGICGIFSTDNEPSSTIPSVRQRSIDYFKRSVEFAGEVGAEYFLIAPSAVGRAVKLDDFEFDRAVEVLKEIADLFIKHKVKGAVEPIRADEVSLCHTFAEAVKIINAVNHKGIQHINGDVYHMLHGEEHIGQTLIDFKDYVVNIHLADTNRKALGSGMLNIDVFIMSLYVIGYNERRAFCSAEPLGPGADPYQQMNGKNDPDMLDKLVKDTVAYFRKREEILLSI
jgi:D-psicose/D-tagatose/L-ribulose 3-epimerase